MHAISPDPTLATGGTKRTRTASRPVLVNASHHTSPKANNRFFVLINYISLMYQQSTVQKLTRKYKVFCIRKIIIFVEQTQNMSVSLRCHPAIKHAVQILASDALMSIQFEIPA
jgi:hypothetical protein